MWVLFDDCVELVDEASGGVLYACEVDCECVVVLQSLFDFVCVGSQCDVCAEQGVYVELCGHVFCWLA